MARQTRPSSPSSRRRLTRVAYWAISLSPTRSPLGNVQSMTSAGETPHAAGAPAQGSRAGRTRGALIPFLGWVPPVTYDWLTWPAIGLLPARLRAEFEIPWGPGRAAVAAWLKLGLQQGRLLFPERWRSFPIANRAGDRVRAAQ